MTASALKPPRLGLFVTALLIAKPPQNMLPFDLPACFIKSWIEYLSLDAFIDKGHERRSL